jgi:hypothetical protein
MTGISDGKKLEDKSIQTMALQRGLSKGNIEPERPNNHTLQC